MDGCHPLPHADARTSEYRDEPPRAGLQSQANDEDHGNRTADRGTNLNPSLKPSCPNRRTPASVKTGSSDRHYRLVALSGGDSSHGLGRESPICEFLLGDAARTGDTTGLRKTEQVKYAQAD